MIDIREARPGPALNAACAKALGHHVEWLLCRPEYECSGYTVVLEKKNIGEMPAGWRVLPCYLEEGDSVPGELQSVYWFEVVPFYSELIGCAWKLVEVMRERWYLVKVEMTQGARSYCGVYDFAKSPPDGTIALGYAKTTELAICRAFLLAHGVTMIEEA